MSRTNIISTDGGQIGFSVMSGKLEGILGLNDDTTSNEFCQTQMARNDDTLVCFHCYSDRMLRTHRKNCVPKFQQNGELLSTRILVPSQVPTLNAAFVRFDGHGELRNELHFINMAVIAECNPQTTFALWTKRLNIVRKVEQTLELPSNLILVYSNPKLNHVLEKPPRPFHKVFNNITRDYTRHDPNCTTKCINCLECYTFEGADVIVEYLK